mmetsp:Transcript_87238/g.260246  ORF Transcript_87238/g.260246 Transcript_87238/m.260246 type:complete len:233 (-) Transcript_87238:57-755(-)
MATRDVAGGGLVCGGPGDERAGAVAAGRELAPRPADVCRSLRRRSAGRLVGAGAGDRVQHGPPAHARRAAAPAAEGGGAERPPGGRRPAGPGLRKRRPGHVHPHPALRAPDALLQQGHAPRPAVPAALDDARDQGSLQSDRRPLLRRRRQPVLRAGGPPARRKQRRGRDDPCDVGDRLGGRPHRRRMRLAPLLPFGAEHEFGLPGLWVAGGHGSRRTRREHGVAGSDLGVCR